MPFTSHAAWQATQLECPHLRRTHSHLSQGTRPSKKATKIIVIVQDHQPFQPPRERLVVPRSVLDSLLTALHMWFSHPSKYQTKRLFSRYFFALDVDEAINLLSSSCHTLTTLISSEKHEDLHNALIVLCSQLHSLHDGGTTVQVDPAPGFFSLATDPILLSHRITLEIGRVKNCNKNPVAERAIEELGLEFLNLSREGGPVSDITLALATENTNSCIRRYGLSAWEVWT